MSWNVPNDAKTLTFWDLRNYVLKYYNPRKGHLPKGDVINILLRDQFSIEAILMMTPQDWNEIGITIQEGKNIQNQTKTFIDYRDSMLSKRAHSSTKIAEAYRSKNFLRDRMKRLEGTYAPGRTFTKPNVVRAPPPRPLSPTASSWEPPRPESYGDSYFGKTQQIKILKQIARSRSVWTKQTVDKMYNYLYK